MLIPPHTLKTQADILSYDAQQAWDGLRGFWALPIVRKIAGITAAGIIAFVSFFVIWMVRDILRENRQQAVQEFGPFIELLRFVREVARRTTAVIPAFFGILFRYAFIYLWVMRYHIRSRIARLTTAIFLCAGGLALAEKIPAVAKISLISPLLVHHESLQLFAKRLSDFFDNPATIMGLILLEVVLIGHHLREPKHHHYERTTLAVLREALTPLTLLNSLLAQPNLAPEDRVVLEDTYWKRLTEAMQRLFRERGVSDLDLSLMRWNQAKELLEIRCPSQPRAYPSTFTLKRGEGVAGKALEMGYAVYAPVVKFRHGVGLVPLASGGLKMRVFANVYKPSAHPFMAILSVPIRRSGTETPDSVVNLSSGRKSAFRGSDFHIANLISVILGLMS
jgi:hypothetical protein